MVTLRRYTELPFVLHILQTKTLTLLNPNSWDDRNDRHFVEAYRKHLGLTCVLALCLTEAQQTYHHWKIFTQGASGACITFKKDLFLRWLDETPEITGKAVVYKTIKELSAEPPKRHDLPFLKRNAYRHEKEFRLLHHCEESGLPARSFPIPLETVDSVILNPWLPRPTFDSMKSLIRSINGCATIPVLHATIVENQSWRKLADSAEV